ncbi:MAG: Ig domain-containing protein, partial [Lentihominibacter sp.]
GDIHYSTSDHIWGEWHYDDEYTENRNECNGSHKIRFCTVCGTNEKKYFEGKGCDFVAFVDGECCGEVYAPECTRCKEYWWGPENVEEDPFFGNTYDDCYDADESRCFRIAVYLDKTSFTETGKEHKPGVSAFIREYSYYYNDETYEDEYELISQEKFPEKYYDVIYSGDGVSAGKHSVTVRFKDKYSGEIVKYYNVYKSPIVSTKIDMYKGKTYNAKRSDATGTIQWKTSNKRIATVSSNGTIKAKKYGKCKLYAKYKGKTYTSQIVIPHHKPYYEAVLDEYDRRTGKVYVYVKNKGKVPLYVYSKGSRLIDFDYKSYDRTLGLSGKKKYVKINPGKEKCVVYKIKGRATWPGVEDKKIRMKFKYEGKYYTRYAY